MSAMHVLIHLAQNGEQMHVAVGQVWRGEDRRVLPLMLVIMSSQFHLVHPLNTNKKEFRQFEECVGVPLMGGKAGAIRSGLDGVRMLNEVRLDIERCGLELS